MRSSDSDTRAESWNTTPSLVFGVVFYGEYFTQNIEIFSLTLPPRQPVIDLILTLEFMSTLM